MAEYNIILTPLVIHCSYHSFFTKPSIFPNERKSYWIRAKKWLIQSCFNVEEYASYCSKVHN